MSAIAGQINSRRPAFVAPAGQALPMATPVGSPSAAAKAPTGPGNARLLAVQDTNLVDVLANLGPQAQAARPSYNGQTLPPPVVVPPFVPPVTPPGPFDNLSWTDAAIGIGVVLAASLAIVLVVRSRAAPAAPPVSTPTTRRTSTSRRR